MKQTFSKTYEANKIEKKIYQFWLESEYFNPDKLPLSNKKQRKETYTIVLPPPNITGSLHIGHALNATIQDILVRQKRMAGYKTLWLPGTDHAGIATQNVVEKELKKEGRTRFDLGQEAFIKRVWQWKKKYGDIILNQYKKLGASCDWSRTKFTMDQEYVQAVEKAFLHYYKKGWIYQGERVINWCPRCQTSLSDLELEYEEEKGKLWYLRYPFASKEGYLLVATTRPETMLGDTAVAVNPKDERYKHLKKEKILLPIQEREIPIIQDRAVDPDFGSGVVKITPAHDLTDWEIKERHNLDSIKVIGEDGKMTAEAKAHQGLTPLQCREKVLEKLKQKGLIEKVEDYQLNQPHCYRCHSLIEPLTSKQWFLKMDILAKEAIEAVKSGQVKLIPKNFEKVYFSWLRDIKDWCISRQIWWGHKIPIKGETDVLDTWFSSALWPFATLGWPKKTKDLKLFYPTDFLSTARDIINLWVTRMIFSGREFMEENPFQAVYIHPTVLTKEGKRMSKSLGTGIDPIELIEKYGADATRFGLAWQLMGGQDIRFSEDNIIMGKKFCNKLWNASRFILLQIEGKKINVKNYNPKLKIVKQLNHLIKSTNKNLENYQFGQAARSLYDFFWHDFCDKFIEEAKKKDDLETKNTLFYVLLTSLKLLHPFIPFITEEIYQKLGREKKCLMVEEWPN